MVKFLTDRQFLFVKILFCSSFFLVGCLPEFIACLFSSVEALFLIYVYNKNRKILVFDNIYYIFFVFIIFMYLMTTIYAVDKSMAVIGFISYLSVLFFLLIAMQLSDTERNSLLELIPVSGVVMILISFLSNISGVGKYFFYVNDRMGGFFQYPNTFALFLLIGFIVLFYKKDLRKKDIVLFLILLMGILLTGSRTVYIMTLFFMIYFCYKNKSFIKIIGLAFLCLGLLIVFLHFLDWGIDIVDRFSSIQFSSSTLLGRFLYYKDGLFAVFRHPFGLGYLGYYFTESQIQTGIYNIRFIHNDFLQMFLDIGFIPGLMFIFIILRSLLQNQISISHKLIILAIVLHCLFDFSLQYKSIFFVLVLLLDFYHGEAKQLYKNRMIFTKNVIAACMSGFMLYFGFALSFYYVGLSDITLKFLPFHSESMIEKLSNISDNDEAKIMAQNILKINKNVPMTYDVLAIAKYHDRDYSAMINYKKQSLQLQKYNMKIYDEYISMLDIAIRYYETNNLYLYEQYIQELLKIPDLIQNVKDNTSSLAYQIDDRPVFQLSEKSIEIINYYV